MLELEAEDRQQRRTTRLRRASRLAPGKTWDTFQHQRLPARLWDQIFQNPMATAAAIDRVVHHSVILEFDVPSYRTREAQGRQQNATDNYQQEEKRQK